MPDMKKHYNEVVRPELMKRLGLTNVMQIPKLQKIVISTGIGTKMDKDAFTEARTHIQALAGQYPVVCKAKKNVANFKLRVGQPVGVMVTLRGARMYEFLDRFVHNALPRIRDFRGVPKKGFDKVGDYNMGIQDVSVFTEIDLEKLKYPMGLNLTIVTSANTDEEAKELLSLMEVPFAR
jgi:large subunit ribosomal protein L5